jgi:hypothetical protein
MLEGCAMLSTRICLVATVLLAVYSQSADNAIAITTFETKDGKKFEAVRYAAFNSGDLKTYVITTLDGKKVLLLETDVLTTSQENVALEKLPENVRANVKKMRAAETAARAEADAYAAQQKVVAAAKRKENDAQAAVNKLGAELAYAQNVIENAQTIIRNAPIEIARAEARYDAAKAELAAGGVGYGGGGRVPVSQNRSDFLRTDMTRAAESKVLIETDLKDAEAALERTRQNIKALDARMAGALVDLNLAKAETKKAIEKAQGVDKEKAAADGELLIGKAR